MLSNVAEDTVPIEAKSEAVEVEAKSILCIYVYCLIDLLLIILFPIC